MSTDQPQATAAAWAFLRGANVVTRTSAEILARMEGADDFLGWAREVLVNYLDFETARPFLKDGVTAGEWAEAAKAPAQIDEAARSYYEFALGKIEDERGISAERSVIKLREYAWLMGRDDVVAAMDAAPYPQYGAPKVAAFGHGMGYATTATAEGPVGCRSCGGTAGPYDLTTGLCEDCLDGAK